jgi:hypothetical protein
VIALFENNDKAEHKAARISLVRVMKAEAKRTKAAGLPREFRFEGSQVRARRVAKGVLSWNRSLRIPPSGLRNWTG